MKRTLKSVVAASIVLGTMVPSVFAANSNTDGMPTDISGNQFAPAIELMLEKGVMINFTGNQFQPDQPATRGQFIAYIYNILKNEGVITQDYTGSNPYSDEDVNFQKQINDMYLFGYLDGLSFTTKKGADAIGEYWKAPVPWISELLCNVAGVSYDNTKPWSAYVAAVGQGWFANTGYSNGKMPSNTYSSTGYYMTRAEMAQLLENFYASQYPNSINGVPVNLTLSAANSTTGQGTADQLTLAGTDINNKAATLDPSQVTYSVSAANSTTTASDGFVNNSGVFTATAAGSYTVTAMYGTVLSASTTINVYGGPSSLAVSASKALVNDGEGNSSSTVTVKVYDANNNLVTNYNGTVTLTSSNGNDASFASSGAAVTSSTVNAVNGVATFTLYDGPSATTGDTASLTATLGGTSATGAGTITVDAPVATSFSVAYANSEPNGLPVNAAVPLTAIQVTALDQAGQTITSFDGSANVSLSGPASMYGSSATTGTLYFSNGVSNALYIQGQQGVQGNVVATVSASGMQSQTFTIPAYVQGAAAQLVATASASSVVPGSPVTITVKELDANGHLAAYNGTNPNNDAIAVSDTVANQGEVSFTAPSLSYGMATFTVTNNGYVGTDTLTLTDGTMSTTVPLTFTAGSASEVGPTVTNTVYVAPGTSPTATFQVKDGGGNNLSVAGDTFALSALDTTTNSALTLSASSVTSNSAGQVSATVTIPSTTAVGDIIKVTPSATGFTGTPEVFQVRQAGQLATSVSGNIEVNGTDEQLSQFGDGNINAGQSVDLAVYGVNAVGTPVTAAGDSLTVTSSNSNVVSVNGGSSATVSGAQYNMPVSGQPYVALKGLLQGTATITVTDTSIPTNPSYSFTVTVNPSHTAQEIVINGLPSTVVGGQTYALSIGLADLGGNPYVLQNGDNGNQGVTVALSDGGYNDFRVSEGGYTTSTVTIPAYGSTAVVYWTAPQTGSSVTMTASAQYTPAGGTKTTLTGSVPTFTVH